jgi:serine/threonine protein kinase HipA of HipAB toxin-antitoxin module
MHVKNFSLMRNDSNEIVLSPLYDLLATKLLRPDKPTESASKALDKLFLLFKAAMMRSENFFD